MNRSKEIIRTSWIGIVANVLLAGFKAVVGILSSSVAIVMDAVNNLSDALSSVITIIGTKLSQRPADRKITNHMFDKHGIIMTVGVYAVATGENRRSELQTKVIQALTAHKEIVQVHGFLYSEPDRLLSVDVVPDLSVHDDAALVSQLTAELQPMVPDIQVSVVVDHNYSE